MTITLKMLRKAGACSLQVDLFRDTFGESVEVTESLLIGHAGKFELDFAARKFFRAPALAEYEKARDAALAEYEKVRAPALAEYEKGRAPAWAEYEKASAPALAEYAKARAMAFWRAIQIQEAMA
jgi:hypothetical protein